MRQIHCHFPITVRVTGRPTDAQLERLASDLVRALVARMGEAERLLVPAGGATRVGRVEVAQERFDPDRYDPSTGLYAIPFYDGGGELKGVPSEGPPPTGDGALVRVEIYLAERLLIVVRDGDRPPLAFRLSSPPKGGIAGQTYQLEGTPQGTVLKSGADKVDLRFTGKAADVATLGRLMKAATERPPVEVHESAALRQPAAGTGPTDPKGERSEPIRKNESAFVGNRPLAELYLDFLARYAGMKVETSRAASGLTADEVKELAATNPRAAAVTGYFTQAWKEYGAAGETDLGQFSILAECLLTQWDRGNYTVLHNLLDVRKGDEGLGLYRRNTPFRYYDESGMAVPTAVGGYRDSGFRAAAPLESALRINITDRGLLQVLEAIRHVTLEDQALLYKAAKGYVDNYDLLGPAVRSGWDGWEAVVKELKDQAPVLVAFLTGHTVALFLERFGKPPWNVVGAIIDVLLKAAGRAFQLFFIGSILDHIYKCGRELSFVRREDGQPLDSISQRHLDAAVILMRELLVQLIAAGLTAIALAAAKSTAKTIGTPQPPAGMQPAPAVVGGGARGSGAVAAGPPAGDLPNVPFGATRLPDQKPSQMSQAGDDAPTAERRPPAKGEPGKAGEPAERPPAPADEGKPRESKEARQMRQDRPTRPAHGPEYFSWEGGTSRNFRGLRNQLRAHRESLPDADRARVPEPNDSTFGQDAETFIRGNSRLAPIWRSFWTQVASRTRTFEIQRAAARQAKDTVRLRELEAEQRAIDKQVQTLLDFGKGEVGNKRPDLVEFFFKQNRAVVTDTTEVPGSALHNFKTMFYIEVIKTMTVWSDVGGVDFKTVTENTVFP